jgi:hypothetical protein
VLCQPFAFAAGDTLTNVITGAVLSMLMPPFVAEVLTFPALSMQVPLADWFAPSVDSSTAAEQEAIPDSVSVPLKLTVTLVLFQPFAFGAGDAVADALGAVLSMLTVAVAGALTLPALSVQVPLAACPAPSLLRTTADVQVPIPDSASLPLKVTVTSVLFQPSVFAAGDGEADAVGAVASRLIVTDCDAVPPALVALQVSVVPAVSAVIVMGPQPLVLVTVLSGSVTVQDKSTSLTYQPLLVPAVPVITGVITGGVPSVGADTVMSKAALSVHLLPVQDGDVMLAERLMVPVVGPVGARKVHV